MTLQTTRAIGRRVALVVLCGMYAVPAAAQPPVPLSLDEAITRSLETSPRVREARARQAAAVAAVDVRRAAGRPVATATSTYLRTNHVDEFAVPQPGGGSRVIFPDIPNNLRVRGELSMPLWTAGRTTALVDGANHEAVAADAETRVVEADLALEVALVYWRVVTARATVEVLDEGLARTEAWVAAVRARVEAGVSSPHEIPQAVAVRARQRVQRIEANRAAVVAGRDLARVTAVSPDREIVPTTPVSGSATTTATVEAVHAAALATALSARAERAALAARARAFEAAGRAALATRLPQVFTFAGVEPARPNARFVPRTDTWHTSWDLGVTVSWSIWDGGRAKAEYVVAQAQADALRSRDEEFQARLDVELTDRRLELESAQAAVSAADEGVAAAAEVHRVMGERFEAGVATSTDVLDAHQAWLEAELERTRLLAAVRIAEARLRRALGAPVR
jgi:outer membrane protein